MNPIAAIVAVGVGVLAAALAIDRRRHWLVTVPAVIVLAGIVIALVDTGQGAVGAESAWQRIALGIGFGLIGVLGGSPVVGLVLRFAQGTVPLGKNGGIVVDDRDEDRHDDDEQRGSRKRDRSGAGKAKRGEREILRGGATIGYLERVALIGAVAAGQPSAIAIIIAIKGLGRFSELDGSEARERFIIGTLTSLVWAGACTAAALLVH
jgi:hypothetical protein